jgi:hypothetical protein
MSKFGVSTFLATLLLFSLHGWSQDCQTSDEIAPQAKTAIRSAAEQVFTQASQDNAAAIRANTIPSFANSIAGVVNDNKAAFSGAANPQIRTSFLLDTGTAPSPDGQFACGVFSASGMSPNGAEFVIPNLPVGKYAIVIQDFIGNKGPYALSTIFQDMNGWKLAGLYVRPESLMGHDGIWYLTHAREFKAKGENHDAWFYYLTSWDLLAPVTFMNTKLLGNIYKEYTAIQPKEIPSGNSPATFTANGKTYTITQMSVYPNGSNFDLQLKYSVPSTSDFNAAQADARSLATALETQYPELKQIFNNIWAHAVDPSGAEAVGLIKLKP